MTASQAATDTWFAPRTGADGQGHVDAQLDEMTATRVGDVERARCPARRTGQLRGLASESPIDVGRY